MRPAAALRRALLGAALVIWSWSSVAADAVPPSVVTDDIDRFWVAYDAVRAAKDKAAQLALIEGLYIAPGTPGLRAFLQAKGYTAEDFVTAIRDYPRYWASVRAQTQQMKGAPAKLQAHLDRFRMLYPSLRPATIYFEIGALASSGTTRDDKVLIGTELAAGDSNVDLSELPESLRKRLGVYFASRPSEQLDLLAVHEFVHTQERGERKSLLAQAIYEGVAEFVAEQVTGRLPVLPYVTYGPAHDGPIRAAFQRDMLRTDYGGWLYNGADNPFGVSDLGYYVGYRICAGYYARATDKRAAIREMIELDFANTGTVQAFADASGWFNQKD